MSETSIEVTPKPKGARLSKKNILIAVENSYGNVTMIARRLNCNRTSIKQWIAKDKDVRRLFEDERDKIVDLAKNKLVEKIAQGSESMIALVLRTLGKNEGFTERQEVVYSGTQREVNLSIFTVVGLRRIANGESPETVMQDAECLK